jgi:hypothetical protein
VVYRQLHFIHKVCQWPMSAVIPKSLVELNPTIDTHGALHGAGYTLRALVGELIRPARFFRGDFNSRFHAVIRNSD